MAVGLIIATTDIGHCWIIETGIQQILSIYTSEKNTKNKI